MAFQLTMVRVVDFRWLKRALAVLRDDRADARTRTTRVHSRRTQGLVRRPVGLRAGESGGGIAPQPINTRKKKESRAAIDRTLTSMRCPSLSDFFVNTSAQGRGGARARNVEAPSLRQLADFYASGWPMACQ